MAHEVALAGFDRKMGEDGAEIGEQAVGRKRDTADAGGAAVPPQIRQDEAMICFQGLRGPQPAEAIHLQAMHQQERRRGIAGLDHVQICAVIRGDLMALPMLRNQFHQRSVGTNSSGVGMGGPVRQD